MTQCQINALFVALSACLNKVHREKKKERYGLGHGKFRSHPHGHINKSLTKKYTRNDSSYSRTNSRLHSACKEFKFLIIKF